MILLYLSSQFSHPTASILLIFRVLLVGFKLSVTEQQTASGQRLEQENSTIPLFASKYKTTAYNEKNEHCFLTLITAG